MPRLLLTPAQVATLLDVAGLVPGIGSPMHGVAVADRLPAGHPERRALLDRSALVAGADGERPNAAVVSALRACAHPDEVLWFGADTPEASVTVCRRGQLYVDCSRRSDHRVSLVFPLDRAQVLVLATSALSGDRPEPVPSGFALRGPLRDAFLLRAIADLNARNASGATLDRVTVIEAVEAALEDPRQLVAISAYGRRADLRSVVDDPTRFDDAIARLTAAQHLAAGEYRLSPGSAAVFDAPVDAAFGVARRVVDDGPDGERRLTELHLRVERRGERLVTSRVVSVEGEPHIELVERTRAEVRSLVGVFLLGAAWDRIAAGEDAGVNVVTP
jgi:hypothetical protein